MVTEQVSSPLRKFEIFFGLVEFSSNFKIHFENGQDFEKNFDGPI